MHVGFILGNTSYIVLCLNAQMSTYPRFTDSTSRYTLNLASSTWVLYSPTNDLVSSWGTCIGPAMNNLGEYHAVIGILTGYLSNNVIQVRVYLDSKLFVSQ